MKKILVGLNLLAIILLTGCNEGQVQPNYGNTENYELLNVTRIIDDPWNDSEYNYLIDNNTGVVYLEYKDGYGHAAITVMFNSDGTIMTENDIKNKQ